MQVYRLFSLVILLPYFSAHFWIQTFIFDDINTNQQNKKAFDITAFMTL